MKNKYIAQQLLASMASHDDNDRFIAECNEKADRVVREGYNLTTTSIVWYFPDSSRIEFARDDEYIRAFWPNQHL